MSLSYNQDYTNIFHSPGVEPWVTGFLKDRGPRGAVLDVGCGLGFIALLLKLHLGNTEYPVGLDISADKVFKAKRLSLYDDLVVADARKLPFRSSTFGTLISLEVLHRLSDTVLVSLEDAAKEGCSIVLSLPSLPKDTSVERLIHRGYNVYRYLLRGFILTNLSDYVVLLASSSMFFKTIRIVLTALRPMLKVTRLLEKGYLLVLK